MYTEGSFRIPAVCLNDWPDRYIHTNHDTPAMIDPTKLLRAAFIAGATGWVLANLEPSSAPELWHVLHAQSLERTAAVARRQTAFGAQGHLGRFHLWHERSLIDSMSRFFQIPDAIKVEADRWMSQLTAIVGSVDAPASQPAGDAAVVFARRPEPKGPMSVFGYDYVRDKSSTEGSVRRSCGSVRREASGEMAATRTKCST